MSKVHVIGVGLRLRVIRVGGVVPYEYLFRPSWHFISETTCDYIGITLQLWLIYMYMQNMLTRKYFRGCNYTNTIFFDEIGLTQQLFE